MRRQHGMKVLVAEKIAAVGIEKLREEFEVDVKTELTPEQLVAEIAGLRRAHRALGHARPRARSSRPART